MAGKGQYPSFAFSLYENPRTHQTTAYKVLGARKEGKVPLVMIHGLSSIGLVDWSPLVEKLAEDRQVLIFDNRDMGHSTLPPALQNEPYDVQDMANDVIELIKHVGFKDIDILGFSMGGMIAQTLLVTPSLPFKIHHAILAATSAKAAHSDLLSAIPKPTKAIMTFEEKCELVRPFIYIGYDPAFIQDPSNLPLLNQRVIESVSTRRPARSIGLQLSVIAGYDVRSRLASIPTSLPVLVIHGKLDKSVYFSERKYIEKGIQHATIAILPSDDIGHMWYEYFGDSFWQNLIGDFCDDLPARRLGGGVGGKAKL